MLTLSSMRSLVRTLTAVSATDYLTDVLLNQLLNEALYEIYRRQGNGWPFAQTALTTDSSTPPFDAQFHMAVVYRAAAKVLQFVSDTTNRAETFQNEHNALVSDMDKFYLPKFANPDFDNDMFSVANNGNTLTSLILTTRDLAGIYDKQIVSDSMVGEIVNVAYTEFANTRQWNTFSRYSELELDSFAPWSEFTATGQPAHFGILKGTILKNIVDEDHDASKIIPRVKAVYVIDTNGYTKQAVYTDRLDLVDDADDTIYYTITKNVTQDNAVYFQMMPEQPGNHRVRFVEYVPMGRLVNYSFSYTNEEDEEVTVFVNTGSEIPGQFAMLIPYRAAQFLLMQMSPEDPRIGMYANMYETLLDSFITYDQLNPDTRTFSIGERGKDTPRWVPWFRPA